MLINIAYLFVYVSICEILIYKFAYKFAHFIQFFSILLVKVVLRFLFEHHINNFIEFVVIRTAKYC